MRFYSDRKILDKYSRDRSLYRIKPSFVAFPKDEGDIIETVEFARKNGLPIVPRGGGTGLSGAGIGRGIVINFSRHFNHVYKAGAVTRTEAGVLLKRLRPLVEREEYMLPSVPLHGDCAIGGNVNTRSVGPRSLQYGMIEKQIKSVRGVLSDGRILDTSKTIPPYIKEKVFRLQKEIKKEKGLVDYLKKRPPVAGGYNLKAFIGQKEVRDMITSLIVGSTGTLLLLTEVVFRLPKLKELNDLYLLYFNDYLSLQKALNRLLRSMPALIEHMGRDVLTLLDRKHLMKGASDILIAGFENKRNIENIIKDALGFKKVPFETREHLWKSRAKVFPKLEKEAEGLGLNLPSGIEDVTFHPKDFSKIMKDILAYEKKSKIRIACFGHVGIGSLHLRPFINVVKNPELFDKLAMDIFKIVKKYGGTLIGEHNSGLCRSRYLEMESKKMYVYMKRVKEIFDPENILNPKIIFNLDPVTKNLKPKKQY